MTSVLGGLAPGRIPKLQFTIEIFAVMAVCAAAIVQGSPAEGPMLIGCAVLAAALWAIGSSALRLHDPFMDRQPLDESAMVSLVLLVVASALFLVGQLGAGEGPRRMACFVLMLTPVILAGRLFGFRRWRSEERFPDAARGEVLILGVGTMGACAAEDLRRSGQYVLAGFLPLDHEPRDPQIPEAQVIGQVGELERILRERPISEVYVAASPLRYGSAMQAAVNTCELYGVSFALPASGFRFGRARPLLPKLIEDGFIHYVNMRPRPYQLAVKRMFDIAASAVALLLLSPLFLVVAALIKLTSKGPVFFKQVRVGLHGRHFPMYKFRSMIADAEQLKAKLAALNEQTGPVFKIKNDPRITPIGRFIRKYSIDELPQLLNVLRGDMSIVGPRPPVPKEVLEYEPWQRRRLSVRPGLTCIWQVSGRNQISFTEWMYLDMQYIDHWSLSDDLALVFRTVPVVLTGRGAS